MIYRRFPPIPAGSRWSLRLFADTLTSVNDWVTRITRIDIPKQQAEVENRELGNGLNFETANSVASSSIWGFCDWNKLVWTSATDDVGSVNKNFYWLSRLREFSSENFIIWNKWNFNFLEVHPVLPLKSTASISNFLQERFQIADVILCCAFQDELSIVFVLQKSFPQSVAFCFQLRILCIDH